MEPDPFIMDPETSDPDHPPSLVHIEIEVEGSTMYGVYFKAQGNGAKPTVILLHGFPGHDRNFDIGHMLRRAGLNVLVFHYRGSWGSGGTFSFGNMLVDTRAVVDHLVYDSQELLVDEKRIIPIGHSMGGWAALMTTAMDDRITSAGSLAGFNLGLLDSYTSRSKASRELVLNTFQELSRPMRTNGPEELLKEVIDAGKDWDLANIIPDLSGKNIMIIGAEQDSLAVPEIHFHPLEIGLKRSLGDSVTSAMLNGDHSFSSCRIALSRCVQQWIVNTIKIS